MDLVNSGAVPPANSELTLAHSAILQSPPKSSPASVSEPLSTASRNRHESGHTPRFAPDSDDGRPRAVVIGAGLGGLSAAIHLARRGWRVDVLERNARSGGRMNVIQEQGFQIDMGPTMLMMPEVLENLFAACGRDIRDYLTMQRIAPAYRICWPDGTCLDMGKTVEEMMEHVRTFAPEDADRIPAFIGKMRSKYLNARHNFIERSFNTPRLDAPPRNSEWADAFPSASKAFINSSAATSKARNCDRRSRFRRFILASARSTALRFTRSCLISRWNSAFGSPKAA